MSTTDRIKSSIIEMVDAHAKYVKKEALFELSDKVDEHIRTLDERDNSISDWLRFQEFILNHIKSI